VTKRKNRAGDANRAMVLQALRGGPMTAMQMDERWSFGSGYAYELKRAGLVEIVADEFRITPAGRAACPYRNPKAAEVAAPEIFTMPKGESRLTRQRVLEAIRDAGPEGLGRAELVAEFAHLASEQSVDMPLVALGRTQPPVVFKPMRGQFVAIEHQGAGACVQDSAKSDTQTALTATDETQAEFAPVAGETPQPGELTGPIGTDIHGISLAVDHHEATDLSTEHLEQQMAQIGDLLPNLDGFETPKMAAGGYVPLGEKYSDRLPTFIPVVEDIRISDPETVEFCIYSSGGLDIFSDDAPPITLDKHVLAKLRGFLGLFQEAV
jgi:hypothetical protein